MNITISEFNQVSYGKRNLQILDPKLWNSLPNVLKIWNNLKGQFLSIRKENATSERSVFVINISF